MFLFLFFCSFSSAPQFSYQDMASTLNTPSFMNNPNSYVSMQWADSRKGPPSREQVPDNSPEIGNSFSFAAVFPEWTKSPPLPKGWCAWFGSTTHFVLIRKPAAAAAAWEGAETIFSWSACGEGGRSGKGRVPRQRRNLSPSNRPVNFR